MTEDVIHVTFSAISIYISTTTKHLSLAAESCPENRFSLKIVCTGGDHYAVQDEAWRLFQGYGVLGGPSTNGLPVPTRGCARRHMGPAAEKRGDCLDAHDDHALQHRHPARPDQHWEIADQAPQRAVPQPQGRAGAEARLHGALGHVRPRHQHGAGALHRDRYVVQLRYVCTLFPTGFSCFSLLFAGFSSMS
jgi:hypothetical protein